ncbi:hypothetical protein ACWKSP_02455 [Micromonosporaceae bacterium Da 78-11]
MPAADPAVIAALESNWQAYEQVARDKLLLFGKAHDIAAWQQARDTDAAPILTALKQNLDELSAEETASAARNAAAAKSGYESGRLASIVVLVIGCLLALMVGVWVARKIVQALSKVKEVCLGLAQGDLTRTTGLLTYDEPGQMGRALDEAMVRLRETVSTIDGSAASLASASEQMSGTAHQIASSAEETTVQAQAVSAAAEEISRSVDTV